MAFTYRYPNTRLDRDSDYLEIKFLEYIAPGFELDSNALDLKSGDEANQKSKNLGTVFLPIPENIQDNNTTNWGEDSINSVAAGLGSVFKNAATNPKGLIGTGKDLLSDSADMVAALGTSDGNQLFNSYMASSAMNLVPGTKTSLGGILARQSGQILNPNSELLFNGVTLRSFGFEFTIAPRDESESSTVKKMIREFKKNMQASRTGASGNEGLFLKSPNVFQSTYRNGNKKHPFLHKFKVMALKDMAVNYTDSGTYATYADATPVKMRLSLSFQELSPIYSEDYEDISLDEGVGY